MSLEPVAIDVRSHTASCIQLSTLDERGRRAIERTPSASGRHGATEAAQAHSADLSAARVTCLVRQQTGVTSLQMLQAIRLRLAAQLLLVTERSPKEIVDAMGFHSVAHFGRLFKRKYGVAPGEYRRSNGMKLQVSQASA